MAADRARLASAQKRNLEHGEEEEAVVTDEDCVGFSEDEDRRGWPSPRIGMGFAPEESHRALAEAGGDRWVVRAAPDDDGAHQMRAEVLRGASLGGGVAWEAGSRSAAELREAATHYERAEALKAAPTMKAVAAKFADLCCREAEVQDVREGAAAAAREIGAFMAKVKAELAQMHVGPELAKALERF